MISSEATARIERPADETFAFVTDPANEPRWHTDVVEARALDATPLGVGSRALWIMSFMGRKEQVMTVTRLEPPTLIEMHGQAIMGLTPTITYGCEPDGDATRFTRRIQMAAAGVGKLFTPMLKAGGAARNERFVRNLKEVLESDRTDAP